MSGFIKRLKRRCTNRKQDCRRAGNSFVLAAWLTAYRGATPTNRIAAGAALAGIIYAQVDYRASTFAGALIALVAAALVWRNLPEHVVQK